MEKLQHVKVEGKASDGNGMQYCDGYMSCANVAKQLCQHNWTHTFFTSSRECFTQRNVQTYLLSNGMCVCFQNWMQW